ncbi:MAG TPA: universal stress protein [Solirubrobacteraceae bacterium]|nr:universal stress protein [Solirubrobacteraceae bacterium]
MRALVWIVEDTWQATVAEAAAYLPAEADVTLLHVADTEAEAVVRAARFGLLGRRPPVDAREEPLRAISEQAAGSLLADARRALGRVARCEARRGRIEREVIAAAATMDIVVLARDGDRRHLGPRSVGPATRFVVDHAPCRVLLIWPDLAPSLTTIPPPPEKPLPPG